jgi:MFS-type transporter involved in bile tolerance (Atg22 family)
MELERIVNRHAKVMAYAKQNRKCRRYHNKVMVCITVALLFLIATACNLVNPVLGYVVMVVSLMNGCYAFGVVKGRYDNA